PESAFETPEASRALAKSLLKETGTASMQELMQLKTEALKDAGQKLWQHMCAPICDGSLIPADVYRAYQDGEASGIEFILGIPGNERQVFRSFIGEANYTDLISLSIADMQVRTDGSGMLEEDAKRVEKRNAACIYHSAAMLSEGGCRVHLLFWDEAPLIEKLGSGSVDAAAALLGNSDALQMYGSIMNEDLSEVLQCLMEKYIKGDALALYPNEIKGIDAIDWKSFPAALIVSDGKLQCGTIEDRIA
ncbi:MAG: hypothetical protein IJ239_03045, partial [Eubacterium sp.]|nr:hypothetical protein [Eubacterium sp.]